MRKNSHERGYIESRKLMDIMRNAKYSYLKERKVNLQEQEYKTITDAELEEEIKNFKESVINVVEFGEFKIKEKSVEWSGELTQFGIKFTYTLEDYDGCYINCEVTQLTDESVELFKKLYNYYRQWYDTWSAKI
jgi:hypothetical protein